MQLKYNNNITRPPAPTVQSILAKARRIRPLLTKTITPLAIKSYSSSARAKTRTTPNPVVAKRTIHKPRPIRTIQHQLLNTKQRLISRPPHPPPQVISPDNSLDKIAAIGTNKVAIIVGNGPSHKEAPLMDLKGIPNIHIISINRPDDRLWPTDLWMFCDNSQQRRHKHLIAGYKGILINSTAVRDTRKDIVRIKSLHSKGFSLDLHKGVFIGKSSVYAAIQVAVWAKYEHIYVFGCDMTAVNGKLYPWGSNPDVSDGIRAKRFKLEAESYDWMATNLDKRIKSKITFCTSYNPYKFIKSFEQLDHMEAVNVILKRHTATPPAAS